MIRKTLILLVTLGAVIATAQTAPCGRAIIIANGQKDDSRFLPASPEFVKASLLNAIPAMGAKVKKVDDTTIEAAHTTALANQIAAQNKALGDKENQGYAGDTGTFNIEWKPDSQGGVDGTQLTVNYKKSAQFGFKYHGWATTLIDETACLLKITSPWDSTANPTGKVDGAAPVERKSIVLPEGTPVQLVLPNILSTKGIKDRKDDAVVLQVQEDVEVDGAVVIRKGALGTGQFLTAEAAKHWGKGASLAFDLKTVTAADGQIIKIIGGTEKKRGKDVNGAQGCYNCGPLTSLLLQGLSKGEEATLRAGSGYAAETVGQYMIEVGK